MRLLRGFFVGRDGEAGQAIILIAIVMLAMLMMVGVAIDAGQLYSARRAMQEAADAAAYGGAVALYEGGTKAQAIVAATADATTNGFTAGGSTFVTVNSPPASGPHILDARYVEVLIQQSVQTSLVPAQASLTTVKVRAVAGATPLDATDAILVLQTGNVPGTFSVASGGVVQVTGGGIMIDSSSASAGTNSGSVSVAPPYNSRAVGGFSGTWPSPLTGQPNQPDPYAGYPRPSTAGLPVYTNAAAVTSPLNPGVYKGGANIGNGNWTFNPGIYIFAGTNINLSSGSLNGSGIMLFFTTANYPSRGVGAGSCGSMTLANAPTSTLDPPTSGTWRGMLIYYDPVCTTNLTVNGELERTTGFGTIYIPNGCLNLGDADLEITQIVAKCITVAFDSPGHGMRVAFDPTKTANATLPALSE